jgi:hypothetical protein
MDLLELINQKEIRDLRDRIDRLQREGDAAVWDSRKVKELAEENLDLKLRLGLLVRLLIAKGVFTAEEYAGLIAGTKGGPAKAG